MGRATSSGDPSEVAARFTDDYHCEVPLHPSLGFTGNEQVKQNWTDIQIRTRHHSDYACSVHA